MAAHLFLQLLFPPSPPKCHSPPPPFLIRLFLTHASAPPSDRLEMLATLVRNLPLRQPMPAPSPRGESRSGRRIQDRTTCFSPDEFLRAPKAHRWRFRSTRAPRSRAALAKEHSLSR